MKKLYCLIVLALILGLALTGCSLLSNVGQTPASPQISEKGVSDDGSTISVYSDTSALITTVYNKALGGNSVVDLSGSPLTAVRAWEPAPYSSNYPEEPPEAIGSTWDKGVGWFETNGSSADWIWETHLANDPAVVYALTDDLYDADAAINGRVVLFELTFEILGNPISATLHIAADNGYEAWVNSGTHFYSTRVSGDGWEDSDLHEANLKTNGWQYDGNFTINSSEFVNGSNTLYVLAGNEYFAPDDGNTSTPASQYNPGAVIFQLDIDYEVVIEEVPGIAIEKSGPVSAHVGDIITYTYTVTTGTGDVPLSAVAVSDDLAGDAAYVSGDDNTNDLLDLLETWIFTANYEVPSGLDPVVNIATAYGTSPQGAEVTAEATWSVDIIHPDIEVTKEADPTMAHEDDLISYTINVENTGDCDLTKVSVIDDHGTPVYQSGDDDLDGKLDIDETWVYTCSGPAEADDFTNTAEATFEDMLGGQATDSDTADVEVLNPAILVDKTADTTVAAPGDTVAYSYTVTNVGDCILYNVSLVDDVVGPIALTGLTDEDGDTFTDDLAQGASATGSADYLVTFDDPEWLVNTATASGTDELGLTVDDEAFWTVHTMCARTIGYWKNHLEDWCDLPEDSMFFGEDPGTLLAYFPGNGIEEDGVNPLEMLRVQLLAAELNVACFDVYFDYGRYEKEDIFAAIEDAEEFLAGLPDDLNTYWSGLGKAGQRVRYL